MGVGIAAVAISAALAGTSAVVSRQQEGKRKAAENRQSDEQRNALLAEQSRQSSLDRRRTVTPQATSSESRRRFQAGFAQTIRNVGGATGLSNGANLSTPALIAGTKTKLGQ